MMFPSLRMEKTIQVNDKVRLDASKSFSTLGSTITDVLIKPEASEAFYSVFVENYPEKWFLDWAFETDGAKIATVRVVTGLGTKDKDVDFDVLDEVTDSLFSTDGDLFPYEPEIYRYLPSGKSSFIYAHRAAQNKIIAYLDEQRIWKSDGTRFDKFELVDKEEFKQWSIFQTLLIIFEGVQTKTGDMFQEKKTEYDLAMKQARSRGALRLDRDGDGNTDQFAYDIKSTRMVRR